MADKKIMERWEEIAKDLLDEKQGVSPAKILQRTYGETGWLPEWEGSVNMKLLRRRIKKRYGKQYATVPVTETFFSKYAENPQGLAEIADCITWGNGAAQYGFVLANGDPLPQEWAKKKMKLKTSAAKHGFDELKLLLDAGAIDEDEVSDVLLEAAQQNLGKIPKALEDIHHWIISGEDRPKQLTGPSQ
jgi:hypothetical protein